MSHPGPEHHPATRDRAGRPAGSEDRHRCFEKSTGGWTRRSLGARARARSLVARSSLCLRGSLFLVRMEVLFFLFCMVVRLGRQGSR